MEKSRHNYDAQTADCLEAHGPMPKAATRNACKLCTPLGAAMVFKGIRNCLPFLHGSQGCATYIRRYLISHFREPVDIASSSFTEEDAIFGGARNFAEGIDNVIQQYAPELLGVATTCLSETIGENMLGMIRSYREAHAGNGPPLVHVSTPAYSGTHSDGYRAAILEVLRAFAHGGERAASAINILPPMLSCADLRYLRVTAEAYGLSPTLLPDYSATLDGESWEGYHRIAPGGTGLEAIAQMGCAAATLEIGHSNSLQKATGGKHLETAHGVPLRALGWPVGVRLSDNWYTQLAEISGTVMPPQLRAERGRLLDSYVDGHKYISGKRVAVFGEPDFVIAMAAWLSEIGVRPVLCATGARLRGWTGLLASEIEGGMADIEALEGADHARIAASVRAAKPDLLLGSSKGYPLARELGIGLMREGFPVHDRFGAQRQLTVGYAGTQRLFDSLVNHLMAARQNASNSGYSYI